MRSPTTRQSFKERAADQAGRSLAGEGSARPETAQAKIDALMKMRGPADLIIVNRPGGPKGRRRAHPCGRPRQLPKDGTVDCARHRATRRRSGEYRWARSPAKRGSSCFVRRSRAEAAFSAGADGRKWAADVWARGRGRGSGRPRLQIAPRRPRRRLGRQLPAAG